MFHYRIKTLSNPANNENPTTANTSQRTWVRGVPVQNNSVHKQPHMQVLESRAHQTKRKQDNL